MKRYLFKNDIDRNISARIKATPNDELGNAGHEGATVIEGDTLTTCLAPLEAVVPEPISHKSHCIELATDGLYAVEVNGVVVPYAFTPEGLMDCFNGEHESLIKFKQCTEDVCLNAISTASTGGVWGNPTITINGVIYPSIYDETINGIVELIQDGELHFIWNNKTTEFQRIEITNASLNKNDYGWGENNNPTMKSDIEAGSIKFCLAPAEIKPKISCDGAISSVSLLVDLYWMGESGAIMSFIDDETDEIITDIQGYYVDQFNPDRDTMAKIANANSGGYFEVIGGEMDDFDSSNDPYGHRHYRQTITISNKRQQPTRIRIEVNGIGDDGFKRSKVELANPINPTYFVSDGTETGIAVSKVCLAPTSPISCAGATNQVLFTSGDYTWDVEINGKLYECPNNWNFSYFVRNTPELSELISAEGDGFMGIANLREDIPLRMRMIPWDETKIWGIHEGNDNPTIVYEENGDILFCLEANYPKNMALVVNIPELKLLTNSKFTFAEKEYTTKASYVSDEEAFSDIFTNLIGEDAPYYGLRYSEGLLTFVNLLAMEGSFNVGIVSDNLPTNLEALPYIGGPDINSFTYPANLSLNVTSTGLTAWLSENIEPTEIRVLKTDNMVGKILQTHSSLNGGWFTPNFWHTFNVTGTVTGKQFMDSIIDQIIATAEGNIVLVGPEGGEGHIQKVESGWYVGAGAVEVELLDKGLIKTVISAGTGDAYLELFTGMLAGKQAPSVHFYGKQIFPSR